MTKSSAFVVCLPVLVLGAAFTAPARAAEPETLEELRARGLGQMRADPIPMPGQKLRADDDPIETKMGIIFVNFDAITLTMGGESSQMNMSSIFGGDFEAYGGTDMQREAVMEAVRIDWDAYDVVITDARPEAGEYVMNVTSPTNPIGGGVLGIAPLDCMDMMTHSNITFAFHGANDGFPASVQATTIGQEVGHSFGLEHVNDPNDIMNPVNAGGDPAFTDTCIEIVPPLTCPQQHAMFCAADGTTQNAHQELLMLFGARDPDMEAPVIEITYPEDGDHFKTGADFTITVDASDNKALVLVELYNNGKKLKSETMDPFSFDVVDIPDGVYRLKVKASDLTGNEAESAEIEIVVGEEAADSGSEGTGGNENDDGKGNGCGCAATPVPTGWSLVPLLLALRRRRPTQN